MHAICCVSELKSFILHAIRGISELKSQIRRAKHGKFVWYLQQLSFHLFSDGCQRCLDCFHDFLMAFNGFSMVSEILSGFIQGLGFFRGIFGVSLWFHVRFLYGVVFGFFEMSL